MAENKEKEKVFSSKSEHDDVDDFTHIVGGCGLWQWQFFTIYFVTSLPSVWNNLIMTFIAPNIDHWCARDEQFMVANISADLWKQTMIPSFLSEKGEIHFSRCHRYDLELNVSHYFFSTPEREDGIFEVQNTSNTTKACQKWEYDVNSYSSTVVSEWDLVCDREWLVSIAKSAFMAGYLVAVLVFGQVSDKTGRRPVLIICAVIFLLSGLVCAFSVSFVMFAVCRFFIALGASGILTSGFVALMEVVGIEHRSLFGIGTGLGWATGYVLLPLIAHFIPEWFWFQIAVTVPCLLVLILWSFVPESPRWLLSQGQEDRAQEILKNIAVRNGKDINHVKNALKRFCERYREKVSGKPASSNILDLVRTPGLRSRTLNLYFN